MCGACCTNLGLDQMILVLKENIERIAKYKAVEVDEAREAYCEVATSMSNRAGRELTQLRAVEGRCIFLDADLRCSIHPHKPLQCRIGPDRFLPDAMRVDYDCMRDVIVEGSDLTEYFFARLLED